MMESVVDRFLRYVSYDTESSEVSGVHPSTEKQKALGKTLYNELKSLGHLKVSYDEKYNYVYAQIPANDLNNTLKLGFIAHMDTSPEMSGKDVKPQIVTNYDGEKILLGKTQYVLDPELFPELRNYIGKTLITTDGTTLLGADDKAGIAEIMTMAAILVDDMSSGKNQYKHGQISIAFTPDEEIGEGVEYFDLDAFDAEYAYTVDGGAIGELEYENFNAAHAKILFHGLNVHPGDAKNKMINAMKLAMEFNSYLPALEVPEKTTGYEGFYHLTSFGGDVSEAYLEYIIRDHDQGLFEKKKSTVLEIAERLKGIYGESSVEVKLRDQYYNMRSKIIPDNEFLIDKAKKAMQLNDVNPIVKPIRGGTDGAMLSYRGLPCPNLCTGGHNYHGRYEFCPQESMEKVVDILLTLVTL